MQSLIHCQEIINLPLNTQLKIIIENIFKKPKKKYKFKQIATERKNYLMGEYRNARIFWKNNKKKIIKKTENIGYAI